MSEDIIGRRYGHLVVLEVEQGPQPYFATARCDCGHECTETLKDLYDGKLLNCGTCSASRKVSPVKSKYRMYLTSARKRSYPFDLSYSEFETIVRQECFYCGAYDKLNGVDRVDNKQGYTLENCVPCCTMCNRMKLDSTLEKFLDQCKRITERA